MATSESTERPVTQREIDQRFTDLRGYVDRRFTDMESAIKLARESMEKRLEGMNEFRDSLRDQASRFLLKSSYDDAQDRELEEHRRLNEAIRQLELSKSELAGKASRNHLIFVAGMSVLSLLVAIIALVFRTL